MNLSFLSFLGEPWFVAVWYGAGLAGAGFLIYDLRNRNTILKPAMSWAWPIIVVFFSVLGLALYFATARAPGVGAMRTEEEKRRAHAEYEANPWRRVNGAVIHCVAGDGLGIMTAMVIARAASMSFWQEFWFEYIVGFAMGWFIFQRKSMTMMTDKLPMQLAMAFRAEFFSMLTVMGGMGAVMTFVTPLVATMQPKPLTPAFWGFGMLGLLAGYVLTFPTNWIMVALGWKHGMGPSEGAEPLQARRPAARAAALAALAAVGCAGFVLPAALTQARQRLPIPRDPAALTPADVPAATALLEGVKSSLARAGEGLRSGDRTKAAQALDGAYMAAQVGAHSAPGGFYGSLEEIKNARLAVQSGKIRRALDHVSNAASLAKRAGETSPPVLSPSDYLGAMVIDQKGRAIGEVTGTRPDSLELALGGWSDAWGFADLGRRRRVRVPLAAVAFGEPKAVGRTFVMLPTRARS